MCADFVRVLEIVMRFSAQFICVMFTVMLWVNIGQSLKDITSKNGSVDGLSGNAVAII